MAAKRQTRRRRTTSSTRNRSSDSGGSRTWNEIVAIVLMGAGLLHFLSLISYNHFDLPSWVSFSSDASPNAEISNFIGPLGAIVAGYTYFFLGAAGFLIPASLVWLGINSLLGQKIFTLRNATALLVFLVSGACIADLQTLAFQDWADRYNIPGSGGVIGYALGSFFLVNTVGRVGAVIVMGLVYAIGLIALTGLHPFTFFRMIRSAAIAGWGKLLEYREARKEARPSPKAEPTPSSRTPRKKKKKKRAKPVAEEEEYEYEEEEEEYTEELPLVEVPEPKIIDTSIPRESEKKNKPTLADLMADRRKERPAHRSPETAHFENYKLPDIELLNPTVTKGKTPASKTSLLALQRIIVDTLETFGISVTPGDITRGPTITRYEIYPSAGLRVNRITALEADLARATKAERINIIAPIPGKDTVGIEIANSKKVVVQLRELLEDPIFCSKKLKIPLALGKDVYGKTIIGDLAQMPHLLIAGATGSGKSVCINGILTSMLYRFSPDELRLILIDPKVVELQTYNTLPHLVIPVVTDPKKVLLALRWVVNEMERRYRIFAASDVRDFDGFNGRHKRKKNQDKKNGKAAAAKAEEAKAENEEDLVVHAVSMDGEEGTAIPPKANVPKEDIPDRIPYVVVVIDELADLMQTAPVDVEGAIQRLAQKARAAGIHLILATQTPRKEVITGNIKTNVPTRIAFQVPSKIDSRVILDASGAERLVGKGDMLYQPPGTSTLLRSQGALITDEEVQAVVKACADQGEPVFEASIEASLESDTGEETDVSDEDEAVIEKCIEVIQQEKRASTSLLQRRLRLGYTRAARMIDILEERGIIGPGDGAKPREILVDLTEVVD